MEQQIGLITLLKAARLSLTALTSANGAKNNRQDRLYLLREAIKLTQPWLQAVEQELADHAHKPEASHHYSSMDRNGSRLTKFSQALSVLWKYSGSREMPRRARLLRHIHENVTAELNEAVAEVAQSEKTISVRHRSRRKHVRKRRQGCHRSDGQEREALLSEQESCNPNFHKSESHQSAAEERGEWKARLERPDTPSTTSLGKTSSKAENCQLGETLRGARPAIMAADEEALVGQHKAHRVNLPEIGSCRGSAEKKALGEATLNLPDVPATTARPNEEALICKQDTRSVNIRTLGSYKSGIEAAAPEQPPPGKPVIASSRDEPSSKKEDYRPRYPSHEGGSALPSEREPHRISSSKPPSKNGAEERDQLKSASRISDIPRTTKNRPVKSTPSIRRSSNGKDRELSGSSRKGQEAAPKPPEMPTTTSLGKAGSKVGGSRLSELLRETQDNAPQPPKAALASPDMLATTNSPGRLSSKAEDRGLGESPRDGQSVMMAADEEALRRWWATGTEAVINGH